MIKADFLEQFEKDVLESGLRIVDKDAERPWGAFFRIDNSQIEKFIKTYFQEVKLPETTAAANLDPKFLIVEPGKMLSWQVHERRAEFWRVLAGPVGAYLSPSDDQPQEYTVYQAGETIDVPVGTRHRLVGLDKRAVITEIWIHADPNYLSDENDIRRIADEFGRQS